MQRFLRWFVPLAVALAACTGASYAAPAPNASWAVAFGSTGTETTRGITTLADGSTVVIGSFSSTVWFGATSLVSAGNTDIYIARINRDGTYAWVRRVGSTRVDVGFGVAEGVGGNILVSMHIEGPATVGTFPITGSGATTTDIVIASMDAATGTFQWATSAGGSGNDYLYRVRPMPDGSILAVGSHQTTATFGSTTLPPSVGAGDLFVTRINADGTFRWTRRLGGSATWDDLFGFWVFPDGSMAAAGYFRGVATFGSTTLTPGGTTGSADALLLKMDAGGGVVWARRMGGPGVDDFAYAVSGYPDGSMLVGGYFMGTGEFAGITRTSVGGQDAFLAKYSANGTQEWVRTAGSAGDDMVRDVVARADGSALMALTIGGSVQWGTESITGLGSSDAVISTLDGDGAITWNAIRGGTGADISRQVSARADGFFTLAGNFSGTATFGGTTFTSRGAEDGFVEGFLLIPDAPPVPVITVGPGHATATVDTTAGASVTSYEITAHPGASQCAIAPPANSCTITGLTPGTTYGFTVVATNAAGRSESSTQASATIPAPEEPAATPAAGGAAETAAAATARRVVSRLAGRIWRVGMSVITAGRVPTGATAVRQSATRLSTPAGLTAGAQRSRPCAIHGPAAGRLYRCTRVLPPGTWRITTEALDSGGVTARLSSRLVVRAARAPAVTG